MSSWSWLQLVLYLAVLLGFAKPLGVFMARVYSSDRTFLSPVLRPVEHLFYRVAGVDPEAEMRWKTYALALLAFNLLGLLVVYALQRLQGIPAFNPQRLGAVAPDSAFNTAASFATNTNWQGYGGETDDELSDANARADGAELRLGGHGMAVLVALARGFARHSAQTIGNFWVDLTRGTLYILLPLALVLALVLVSQGVVQTLQPLPDCDAGAAHNRCKRAKGRPATAGRRPGRLADRHQAVGHQRRRVLQRQLSAPLREPHAVFQFLGGTGDPADPGGAVLHLWQDGRRHAPGMGDPGRDDDHLRADR